MQRVPAEHSSRDFEAELRALRAHILAMGTRCEKIVEVAFDAFLHGTPGAAREVATLDRLIDRDDVEIHALILRMLALRQPVADDLRLLATALRLITDLERIGDEAVNIAERVAEDAAAATRLVRHELTLMSGGALDMLHLALEAFIKGDDLQADDVLERDDDVDRRCGAVIATMTDYMSANTHDVEAGLRVIRVAKYLERIADHATNVAEEIIFMLRGDDVRHGCWQSGMHRIASSVG